MAPMGLVSGLIFSVEPLTGSDDDACVTVRSDAVEQWRQWWVRRFVIETTAVCPAKRGDVVMRWSCELAAVCQTEPTSLLFDRDSWRCVAVCLLVFRLARLDSKMAPSVIWGERMDGTVWRVGVLHRHASRRCTVGISGSPPAREWA